MRKHHDFCDCKDCCFKKEERKKDSCDFVKDKLCCEWRVPRGQAQNVYVAAGVNVFASGFISYDCGDAANVVVRFFNGNTPVGGAIGVFEGSCTTFTVANFTRIEVECPGGGGAGAASNGDLDEACCGQICITPRYQVECNFDNDDCDC